MEWKNWGKNKKIIFSHTLAHHLSFMRLDELSEHFNLYHSTHFSINNNGKYLFPWDRATVTALPNRKQSRVTFASNNQDNHTLRYFILRGLLHPFHPSSQIIQDCIHFALVFNHPDAKLKLAIATYNPKVQLLILPSGCLTRIWYQINSTLQLISWSIHIIC